MLMFLQRSMVRILHFHLLENALAATLSLICPQLMMTEEMFFVSHKKVVGHPKEQHINEEGNDQHNNDKLELRILERREDQVLHLIPVVHLDYEGR